MSLSKVIKKALQSLNRQYSEYSTYQKYLMNNAVRVVNHKYISTINPNRYSFFERTSSFLFMATQSPNKFKLILNLASHNLQLHSNTLNTSFKWVKRLIFLGITGLFSFGSYKAYEEYIKLEQLMKEQENIIQERSVSWLGMIIREQVYKNTSIQLNLQGLIVNLCEKPSIRHNTVKGLIRIYDIKDVKNTTPTLIKSVLKTNVLYEDYIFEKLKIIIIQQLRSPLVRGLLQDVLVQFGKSDFCKEFIAFQIGNALQNEGVKQVINSTGLSTIHHYLDNSEMRQFIVGRIRAAISGPSTQTNQQQQQV